MVTPGVTTVVNCTLAVWVMATESPVALKVSVPTVPDFTVKVTTPLALLTLLDVWIVALPLPTSETVFPETTAPPESLRVTVIVEVVVPSAGTDVGEAVTVEVDELTGLDTAEVVAEADAEVTVEFIATALSRAVTV